MRGVSPPRLVRALLGSLALGAPFALVAHAGSGLVAPITHAAVSALLCIATPLSATNSRPTAVAEDVIVQESATIEAASKAPIHRGAKPGVKAKPTALFVSEATVLRLAQSSARPHGSFVPASPLHPAGLRLSGVAALGIGLQDGDVLIEALGITPHAPAEIIGAIIEARAKQARLLSGTIWRQGQTFRITVEQPYLPARN
jgi:hypothetical protein